MATVAAVYTAQALVEPLSEVFADLLPDHKLVNITDGGLIGEVIQAGQVTSGVSRRLLHCYMAAVDAKADVILNTCSSVGDVVGNARWFVPVPILKIDEPMAREAIAQGKRIGVMATLPTTLDPTVRLVRAEAEAAGKSIEIVEGLAAGAFQALIGGDAAEHDRFLRETAGKVASQVDVIVLAQGSMARMADELADATGIPVLSSPRSGVAAVGRYLAEMTG